MQAGGCGIAETMLRFLADFRSRVVCQACESRGARVGSLGISEEGKNERPRGLTNGWFDFRSYPSRVIDLSRVGERCGSLSPQCPCLCIMNRPTTDAVQGILVQDGTGTVSNYRHKVAMTKHFL